MVDCERGAVYHLPSTTLGDNSVSAQSDETKMGTAPVRYRVAASKKYNTDWTKLSMTQKCPV